MRTRSRSKTLVRVEIREVENFFLRSKVEIESRSLQEKKPKKSIKKKIFCSKIRFLKTNISQKKVVLVFIYAYLVLKNKKGLLSDV